MRRPRGVRARLLVSVVAVDTSAVVTLVAAFNIVLDRRLSASTTGAAQSRARAVADTLLIENGRIVVPRSPDAGLVGSLIWIFDRRGAILEEPKRADRLEPAAAQLAIPGSGTREISEFDARLYGVPVTDAGRRVGAVVAAVSTGPYRESLRAALIASSVLGLLVIVAVAVAARWILGRALRPVTQMTSAAAAWSDRDLDRRFDLGAPYDELTELAATLDGLLDRLASSLRREQRFTAELSHELRTPLARITGESELALQDEALTGERRTAFEAVHRDAEQMTRIISSLVTAARHGSGLSRRSVDARDAVLRAIETARPLAKARGIEIDFDLSHSPVPVNVESELVERILQPILENACRYANRRVDVVIARGPGTCQVRVEDDGAGIAAGEEQTIFSPGVRGRAGATHADGAGLGLSLALRLVESAGGKITARADDAGGRFLIELPSLRLA